MYNLYNLTGYKHQHSVTFIILNSAIQSWLVQKRWKASGLGRLLAFIFVLDGGGWKMPQDFFFHGGYGGHGGDVGWRNHAVKRLVNLLFSFKWELHHGFKSTRQVIVEAALIGKHLQKNMLMRLCCVILMHYISWHPPKDVSPSGYGGWKTSLNLGMAFLWSNHRDIKQPHPKR